jgi:hypothetical protein
MTNLFPTDGELPIHEKYDLKGSTVGRTAGAAAIKANPRMVRKDLDFHRRLSLPATLAEHLAAQVFVVVVVVVVVSVCFDLWFFFLISCRLMHCFWKSIESWIIRCYWVRVLCFERKITNGYNSKTFGRHSLHKWQWKTQLIASRRQTSGKNLSSNY